MKVIAAEVIMKIEIQNLKYLGSVNALVKLELF